MEIWQDIRASRIHARAFVIMGIGFGAFAAYAPEIKTRTGLGDAEFGLALLFGAVGAVSAMLVSWPVARLFGGQAMRAMALIMSLGFVGLGFADNGLVLALVLFWMAAAAGILDVVMNARLSRVEAKTGRSLMNLNHGLFSLAYGCSALCAGGLRGGGVPSLVCFSLVLLVALLFSLGLYERVEPRQESDDRCRAAGLSWPLLIFGGLIVLLSFTAEQASENWSALHLERAYGAHPAEGALGPAILGFTMAFGRIMGQEVLRYMTEGRLLQLAATLAGGGLILAAVAPVQGLSYCGFAFLGLGVSVVAPTAFAWIGKAVPQELREAAVSRMVIIGYCGFFVGPPAVGALAEALGLANALAVVGTGLFAVPLVLVPGLRAMSRRQQVLVR